jgi:hypothetical protein
MSRANTSAFGIYKDQATLASAIDVFRAEGFRNTDLSILYPENSGTKDFTHQKHTKAPEGAVAGGGIGGVLGAGLGWVAGAGALAGVVPGLEQFTMAGPIMTMLGGLGMGMTLGSLTGGVVGATKPEYEAVRYDGRVRDGGILMSVHCDDAEWTKTALRLLKQTGATRISTAGEAKADFAKSWKPKPRSRVPHAT